MAPAEIENFTGSELAQAILVVAGGSVAGQRGLARSLQAIDQASITLRAAALSGD